MRSFLLKNTNSAFYIKPIRTDATICLLVRPQPVSFATLLYISSKWSNGILVAHVHSGLIRFICVLCLFVFICVFLCFFVFICVYLCLFVFICACLYLFVFSCVYLCLFLVWGFHNSSLQNFVAPSVMEPTAVKIIGGCRHFACSIVWFLTPAM